MRRSLKKEELTLTLENLLQKRTNSLLKSFGISPEPNKYHASYQHFLGLLPASLSKKYKDLDQKAGPLEIESILFPDIEKILKHINPEMTERLKEWNQIHALSPNLITFMVNKLKILPKDAEVIINALENTLYQHNNREKLLEIVHRYTESIKAQTGTQNGKAFHTFLKHLEASNYKPHELIKELYSLYEQNNAQER